MKRKIHYLALVLALLTLSGHAFSQWWPWTLCYSGSTVLYKVFTLDANHAYVVGDNGVFLRTTNGGYSWDQIQTNTTKQLFDVFFIDASTGFICGENGTLLKSIDGGNSWNSCTTNSTLYLTSIYFINGNIGWISGSILPGIADSGVILKTLNGGNSFIVSKGFNAGIPKISAYNLDTCLAISDGYNGSYILKTTNSGSTWQIIYITNGIPLTSIETFKSGLAYVSGYYEMLYKTNDFGTSWDSTSLDSPQFVTDLSFPSPDTGYTAGFDPSAGGGAVLTTNDGGLTWWEEIGGGNPYCISVDFANDSIGFAVLYDGKIYKRGVIDGIVPGPKPIIPHIQVYPDPVTSSINIVVKENPSNGILRYPLVVEIYSVIGEKLLEKQFSGAPFIINGLEQLSPGMYNILIRDRSSFLSNKKFIKKE